jgi:hypothetical protein
MTGQPVGTASPDLETELAAAAGAVERAINELNAGTIDEHSFQARCLEAGIIRHDGVAYIWDWVNGMLYGYDGLQLVTLESTRVPPTEL